MFLITSNIFGWTSLSTLLNNGVFIYSAHQECLRIIHVNKYDIFKNNASRHCDKIKKRSREPNTK